MTCPRCGAAASRVRDTDPGDGSRIAMPSKLREAFVGEPRVLRRRECERGHRWTTIEVRVDGLASRLVERVVYHGVLRPAIRARSERLREILDELDAL